MKLKSFRIQGFRRILDTTIEFRDATFFIGENNTGKSTVLKALELFFSGSNPDKNDYLIKDVRSDIRIGNIILTATFDSIPPQAHKWKFFKRKIVTTIDDFGNKVDSIIYRKNFPFNAPAIYEMKEYSQELLPEFKEATTIKHLINLGVPTEDIEAVLPGYSEGQRLSTPSVHDGLKDLSQIWNVDSDKEIWFNNPGGFQGNILSKIPKFLLIPAEDKADELSTRGGALQQTMKKLFEDVRERSSNYKEAQKFLNLLAKELDPNDSSKEFGKMMQEVNSTLGNVFPESLIHVETTLSDPDSSISPKFEVELSSNVRTPMNNQGMGTIRSAVFALLRYRQAFLERVKKNETDDEDDYTSTLIIGFEEPEIYLHPNAANNMRDEIYNLSTSSNSQIVATTHSPYMIDVSKDLDQILHPRQILNLMKLEVQDGNIPYKTSSTIPFNITKAFNQLATVESDFVKYILKMDDYVSRVFFAKNIIIVEGDTEDIVLRETIQRIPEPVKKLILSEYQIIKARGKAAIIALVKYLRALSIDPFVIHDEDTDPGATKFNDPIKETLSSPNRRFMFSKCIEDELGYPPPSNNKPYKAYQHVKVNWPEHKGWEGVQDNWRKICEEIFFFQAFKNEKLCQLLRSIINYVESK